MTIRILCALVVCVSANGQILSPIVSGSPQSYYVDAITPGNDSNSGSMASPWATLAHAAATINVTTPLYLKYPDGVYRSVPPTLWTAINAYYPFQQASDATKVYDIANGNHATIHGTPTWYGVGLGFNAVTGNYASVSGATIAQPDTVMTSVYRTQYGTSTGVLFDSDTSSNRQIMRMTGYASGNIQSGATSANWTRGTIDYHNPWATFTAIFNGTSSKFYDNGVQQGGNLNAGTTSWTLGRFGNNYANSGVFSTVISGNMVVSGALSDASIAALHSWYTTVEIPRIHEPPGLHRLTTDTTIAQLPPMGWAAWYVFGSAISDSIIRSIADSMVSTGMVDAGYNYLMIGIGWIPATRDGSGDLLPDATKFPNGMKAVADYVHSKGIKFGLATSPGSENCVFTPGSLGYEARDIALFASWGVDYLKYDLCSGLADFAAERAIWRELKDELVFQVMGQALQATGRPMLYSINNTTSPYAGASREWMGYAGAHMARLTDDVYCTWASISGLFATTKPELNGPSHWGDADGLHAGKVCVTEDEALTQMSLWSMLATTIFAGNDIRSMSANTSAMLLNTDVLAVDQDPLGIQGVKAQSFTCGATTCEVWAKQLTGTNTCAIALFNRDSSVHDITATFATIAGVVSACGSGPYTTASNLWGNWPASCTNACQTGTSAWCTTGHGCATSLGTLTTSYTATNVPAHGVVMLKVAP